MAEEMLYRPRELYARQLEKQYHKAAEDYYESLAEKGELDKDANASHVRDYLKAKDDLSSADKAVAKARSKKNWAIAGTFLCLILGGIGILAGIYAKLWWVILLGVLVLLGMIPCIIAWKKCKKSLTGAEAIRNERAKVAEEKLQVCYKDMAGLNALLDDGMPQRIMEGETPIIDLDLTFTPARLCHLMQSFGMKEELDPETSVLGVVSGQVSGNPFVLEKVRRHHLGDKAYHGSLVISWTTTYTDSQGRVHTQHHTQTLHATTYHPAPSYWEDTRLIYGSEVAPHLHFTRHPSGMSGKSEKECQKFVKDRVKELNKKEEKALKSGGSFTKLGNDEFDAFFGADNRDHEVEYRLLFTPLAQRNELDLIKNPDPYGDDFVMVKDGMLTSVSSGHSQAFNYFASPSSFAHYDFEQGKAQFATYVDKFIRGLFFDLAPILSIPLYQTHMPAEYIYGEDYPTHITSFEHEALANKLDKKLFLPPEADPSLPLILKQVSAKKMGEEDETTFSSFSYHTSPQVDFVPKMGGDGRMHQVPVHWTKYDYVSTKANVGFASSSKSRAAFAHPSLEPLRKYLSDNGFHFERGFLAFFLGEKGHVKEKDEEILSSYFRDEH